MSALEIQRLRILHISDLHARGAREAFWWRRRSVLGEAWDQNLRELLDDGAVDLIFFTGDLANWGKQDEYDDVQAFIEDILLQTNLSAERLFVVPGNHDIDRSINPNVWERFRLALSSGTDTLAVSQWMAGDGAPPAGIEPAWRDAIVERQRAYRHWVRNGLRRPQLDPTTHGRYLGYRTTFNPGELKGLPFAVHVIGLDTAWLSGDDSDAKNLRLTEDQAGALTHDERGHALVGLRLALMHHPFDELADGANSRRLLSRSVDLTFRGHLHEAAAELWADPDRRLLNLATGCLYDSKRQTDYPNACSTITLELDKQGRLRAMDIRFRSWASRGGFWHDDNSIYHGSQHGRLRIDFSGPPGQRGPDAKMGAPASPVENEDAHRSFFMAWQTFERGGASPPEVKSTLSQALSLIEGSSLVDVDFELRDAIADRVTTADEAHNLLLLARSLLAKSGSREMALPPGFINAELAPVRRATAMLDQAGKVGAPAVAAICAATILTYGTGDRAAVKVLKSLLERQRKLPNAS